MIRILKWFLIAFIFPWYLCLGQDLTSIPELTGPVVDQVGLLGDNEKSQLEQKLKAFYQTSQVQSQILIISTLGQEPIENYSIRVVEKWKLGHKDSDLGLLLTIVKDDRKMRIEVGQGLEGEITDFTCSRIIRQILAPHFKNGSFYQGLLLYHQEIESLVKGNAKIGRAHV